MASISCRHEEQVLRRYSDLGIQRFASHLARWDQLKPRKLREVTQPVTTVRLLARLQYRYLYRNKPAAWAGRAWCSSCPAADRGSPRLRWRECRARAPRILRARPSDSDHG